MRHRLHAFVIPILAIIALVATACGGAATPAPATTAAATPAPTQAARTIKHAVGETKITGTPQRVVALEWTYVEDLVALGVTPAGIADIAGYKKWVNVRTDLSDKSTDVGTRQQPSLEAISKLSPDLIIGVDFRHKTILDKLTAIAPTLLFNPYPAEGGVDQLTEMEQTFLAIGDAMNKQKEAQAVLSETSEKYKAAAAKIAAAKPASTEFLLVQAFSQNQAPQLRVFIETGMGAKILTKLGLKNAYKGKFDAFGFNTVGVEAFTAVQSANFFYVVQNEDNVFANQLKDNPVWKGLAFVKENRAYALGADLWLFGGPISAQRVADKVASLLAK